MSTRARAKKRPPRLRDEMWSVMLVTHERGGSLARRGVKTPLGYRLSDRRLQKQTETDVRDGSKKISSKEAGSALGKVATRPGRRDI